MLAHLDLTVYLTVRDSGEPIVSIALAHTSVPIVSLVVPRPHYVLPAPWWPPDCLVVAGPLLWSWALLLALGPIVCRAISFIVGYVYGGPAGLLCELISVAELCSKGPAQICEDCSGKLGRTGNQRENGKGGSEEKEQERRRMKVRRNEKKR